MVDLRLVNPFSLLVAGSSQTGKSVWVAELLRKSDRLYSRPPGPVVYFYREWQELFDGMEGVEFRKGIAKMEDFRLLAGKNATVVMDDLMHQVGAETAELFTVGSSRYGVNVIFISQNMFDKNPHFRTISLNCKYICVRKNPRDTSSIQYFARQVTPTNTAFLTKVYRDVTRAKPFSYIFFDAAQGTQERLRVRTNVLGEGGEPMQCFVSDASV